MLKPIGFIVGIVSSLVFLGYSENGKAFLRGYLGTDTITVQCPMKLQEYAAFVEEIRRASEGKKRHLTWEQVTRSVP